MIEASQEVIEDNIEETLEISPRMVKNIYNNYLNLEEAVVKKTKDNTPEDHEIMTDPDLEIGEMENMKHALDVIAMIVYL